MPNRQVITGSRTFTYLKKKSALSLRCLKQQVATGVRSLRKSAGSNRNHNKPLLNHQTAAELFCAHSAQGALSLLQSEVQEHISVLSNN